MGGREGGWKSLESDVKHIRGNKTKPHSTICKHTDGTHHRRTSMDTRTNSMNRFLNEENMESTYGKLSLGSSY